MAYLNKAEFCKGLNRLTGVIEKRAFFPKKYPGDEGPQIRRKPNHRHFNQRPSWKDVRASFSAMTREEQIREEFFHIDPGTSFAMLPALSPSLSNIDVR